LIVRTLDDRIQLITQPDHAHVARAVMERCAPLSTRPRRDDILLAIAEHDNGWTEEDAAPRVDPATGHIFDFVTAPAHVRQMVWPRGVGRLAANRWAAALVAQHAITIYDRFRSDPEWTPFFTRMQEMRDTLLHASGLSLDELLGDYGFVRLADLLSLAFCTGWKDEHRFGKWAVQLFDTRVRVTPDAFGDAEIPIAIDAREVPNRTFRSDADLHREIERASRATLRGTVGG
jgi:hypothetical protein